MVWAFYHIEMIQTSLAKLLEKKLYFLTSITGAKLDLSVVSAKMRAH